MSLVLYNNKTGIIIGYGGSSIEAYTTYMSDKDKEDISGVHLENLPSDYYKYKIVNEKLVRMADEEIQELRLYGKILTEEERLLNQLTPSYEEITKAKNTIEMINLIQEVM